MAAQNPLIYICKLIDSLVFGSIKQYSDKAKDHVEEMNAVLGFQRPIPRNWTRVDQKYL